ncbi:DUF1120 domain-containing protein [Castellaniella ginsengisoli]|uniref:DUF1120 domain-containing protein n=1 Tax=Castellaniella ginsengisoli TaxID=546114 RepID=A0AB39CJY7_9BURK
MKRTLLSLMIATSAATPMLANAASSVQLKVTGTIVPASCSITMPGGTTIDYGKIASDTLKKDAPTMIGDDVRAKLQVSCDAPTLFAIKTTDERAGSAITGTGEATDVLFGLGKTGSTDIGAYRISLVNVNADGKTVNVLRKAIGDTSYAKLAEMRPGAISAFGDGSNAVPVAYKNVTADLSLKTYVQKASALPLKQEVKFDGQTTFEVVYL